MADSVVIKDNEIASAVYDGIANNAWLKTFVSGILANPWVQKIRKGIRDIVEGVQILLKDPIGFFKQWFEDDPGAATAAAGAVGLSFGVLIILGGTAAGFLGGLAGLKVVKLAIVGGLGLISLGGVLRHIVRGVQFIWNFDFNITDEKIAKQQEAALNGLYTLAGDALGNLLGTVVCGSSVAAGVGIVRFDIKAAVNVIRVMAADEDIRDEITSRFDTLISGSLRVASKIAFLEIYKNVRKWIKASAKNPLIKSVLPGSWEKVIAAWGAPGSEPFIISEKIEEAIENIKDEKIRNFTEAFYEAFTDACTETTLTLSTANI